LWFGLLGGPLAWLAHLLLVYVIGEFGCLSPLANRIWLGLTPVAWMVIGATAITLVPAALATLVAYRGMNRLGVARDNGDTEQGRPLLAYGGVPASGIAALTILVESLPVLYYLRDC
jgi:hypothetical protein